MNKFLTRITVALSKFKGLHFYLKSWERASDFESIHTVMENGLFEAGQVMNPLPVKDYKNVLFIAPHQDDESIGCGGLIQKIIQQKGRFDIYYSTEGEQDSITSETRFTELERALDGGEYRIIRSGISNLQPEFKQSHLDELRALIDTGGYDAIFVPWIFDSPPKHRLAHYMFHEALKVASSRPVIAQYQVHSPIVPNYFLDVTDVMEKKKQMIAAFESQLAGVADYVHTTEGLNAWNSRLTPHVYKSKYAELYAVLPAKVFLEFNQRIYKSLLDSLVPDIHRIDRR